MLLVLVPGDCSEGRRVQKQWALQTAADLAASGSGSTVRIMGHWGCEARMAEVQDWRGFGLGSGETNKAM